MRIIVNKCHGGFGLSDKAYERLGELGIPIRKYIQEKRGKDGRFKRVPENEGEVIFDRRLSPHEAKFTTREKYEEFMGRYWDAWTRDTRSHPLLLQVVKELGKKSWGQHAKLEIVEIPDGVDYEIDDYDGIETIHEKHRSW